MNVKIVQMVGRMLVGMAVVNLAAHAGDVARVYVVRPASGVTTYLVDDANAWRLEGTFFSRNDLRCKRPIALVRAGPFFYALDQYEDSQLGYFSISRYDAKGAYRGKLVEKCTLTSPKADNMTVSPDGAYLYVSCFNGGSLLRVSTADGNVEVLTSDNIGNSRGCCVSANGDIYVANRAKGRVNVYSPDGTKSSVDYPLTNASGVLCDDEAGKVYVADNSATTRIYEKGNSGSYSAISGTGNAMAIAKVNGRIVFGNWAGQILSYDPGTGTLSTILTGLGNIQHFHVEAVGGHDVAADPRTISFAAPASGAWYAARDEGLGATHAGEKVTVYRSADRGATWSLHSVVDGVCHPAIYVGGGKTVLMGEATRDASATTQTFVGKTLSDDGLSWNDSFQKSCAGTEIVLSGGMVAMPTMFGGVRPTVPINVGTNRSVALFSTLTPNNALYPDSVLSKTNAQTATYLAGVSASNFRTDRFGDSATAFALPGGGVATVLPVAQRRAASADRVLPEFVTVYTNWFAAVEPTLVGFARVPGGSKPLGMTWDASSSCYWAVSTPATNENDMIASDVTDVRNVLAVSVSTNLFDWTMVSTVRAEGTPETVAFAKPCIAIDGDDLVVLYTAAGAFDGSAAGAVTADGSLAFQRIRNFRSLKPSSIAREATVYLQTDFNRHKIYRYVQEPVTGEWHTDGMFVESGLQYPVGLAAANGRVYVTCETIGVQVLKRTGQMVRTYPTPADHKVDAIVVSRSERTAWITDIGGTRHGVLKLDLASGTWTELVVGDSNFQPRAIAVKPDGSFYLASRKASWIRHYAADGATYSTVVSDISDPVSLALDETGTVLYCGTLYGRVVKFDLANGNALAELTYPCASADQHAFSISPCNGRLIVSDSYCGVFSIDANAENQIPTPVMGGGHMFGRGLLFNLEHVSGTLMLVR